MKLAISNIAWEAAEDRAAMRRLAERGVAGIEVAPTRVWPGWNGATPAAARALRRQLQDEGFAVPALQAILFGKPELSLFGDRARTDGFVAHLRGVAELAAELQARVLVLGAPKNRDRGARDDQAAMDDAAEVLGRCAAACADHGVVLGLEPNPTDYGCNFVTTSTEGRALVERVASPALRLHLDAAGMALAREDAPAAIAAAQPWLVHFHISEPHLAPILPSTLDHAGNAQALRRIGYDGWVSIEMRRSVQPLHDIERALDFALACYGDGAPMRAATGGPLRRLAS